jgi:hypothetical protein
MTRAVHAIIAGRETPERIPPTLGAVGPYNPNMHWDARDAAEDYAGARIGQLWDRVSSAHYVERNARGSPVRPLLSADAGGTPALQFTSSSSALFSKNLEPYGLLDFVEGTASFSFFTRVRIPTTTNNYYFFSISDAITASGFVTHVYAMWQTSQVLRWVRTAGGTAYTCQTDYPTVLVPLNAWYSVLGTYDGTNMRIYVNGVHQASATSPVASSGAVGAARYLTLGAAPSGTVSLLQGLFGCLLTYSRCITDAGEITGLHTWAAGIWSD